MPNVTIASGFTVSSAFYLDRSDRTFAVYCASAAASNVTAEFPTASGATFEPVMRADGTGLIFSVLSAAGGGWQAIKPMTSWGRLRQSPATTDTRTFALMLR